MKLSGSQKGFAPIVILLLLVIIIGVVGVGGSFYLFRDKPTPPISAEQPKSNENNETQESPYPIYPGAASIGTEKAPSCEEAPARGECGQTASLYQTKDSRDKVLNWYQSDSLNSGWKFEPLNEDPVNSNPVFGYLRKGESLLYTEFYSNEDNTTKIKIYNNE